MYMVCLACLVWNVYICMLYMYVFVDTWIKARAVGGEREARDILYSGSRVIVHIHLGLLVQAA